MRTRYAPLVVERMSSRTGSDVPTLATALFTSATFLSPLIVRTANSSSAKLAAILSTAGNSRRHAFHPLFQKFRSTGVPAKSVSETVSPVSDSSSNCGAATPVSSGGAINLLRNSGGHQAAVEQNDVATITISRIADIRLPERLCSMIVNITHHHLCVNQEGQPWIDIGWH